MRAPRTLDRLGDWLNPIVVKELRQAVQSKFIVAVLLLFLLVQLVVIGILVGVNNPGGNLDSLGRWSGRQTFLVLNGILLGTCLLLIPAYTGARLAAERSDTNVDLLFITTLPPRAIITGKLLASLVLVVLIFSAFTPFLFFTYLLRGIDVPSILLVLGVELLAVTAAIQLAIFLAVIPANRVFRVLLALAGVGSLLVLLWLGLGSTYFLAMEGAGGVAEPLGFWVLTSWALTVWLGIVGLLYTWSLALLSPPSANRALLPRLFLVVLWLISGTVAGAASLASNPEVGRPLIVWCSLMATLFALEIGIAVNEREEWTPRVARTIPRSRWLRVPAFLFYSGAAGGLTFAVLGFGLTLGVIRVWWAIAGPPQDTIVYANGYTPRDIFSQALITSGLYSLAYALSAVLVRRFLAIHRVYTWVVLVILIALGCAISGLVYLFLYPRWDYDADALCLLTNPFIVFYEAGSNSWYRGPLFTMFAGAWAGLVTLLNLPWLWRQVRKFRPYRGPGTAAPKAERSFIVTAAQGEVTKTLRKP